MVAGWKPKTGVNGTMSRGEGNYTQARSHKLSGVCDVRASRRLTLLARRSRIPNLKSAVLWNSLEFEI